MKMQMLQIQENPKRRVVLLMANTWWGYLHVNGGIQVKRFFSQEDLDDANESPFVKRVFEPFEANSREQAILKVKAQL